MKPPKPPKPPKLPKPRKPPKPSLSPLPHYSYIAVTTSYEKTNHGSEPALRRVVRLYPKLPY